jgi:xanthine dehydrogenase accessory factor
VGSLVAVRGDGRITGSVSGGCIEDELIDAVCGARVAVERPQILRYGAAGEATRPLGLPCGGTIELVVETLGPASAIDALLERLARGERVQRSLRLADGSVCLAAAGPGDALRLDAEQLVTTHGPSYRLLLIGAGQLSHYLAGMALTLGYEVLVCDPREAYAGAWAVTGARLLAGMPDDVVNQIAPDAHTAVIALSHDAKLDDLALLEALRSPAFYVGAIGSLANQRKRRARLKEYFGLDDAQLDRLHGPVGLKNGARTPPEIAVSILAELTAVRYRYRIAAPVPLDGDLPPATTEARAPLLCATPADMTKLNN